jgi:hypothetical protein
MSDPGDDSSAKRRENRSELDRADELIEDWSRRLGRWISVTAARAKEEAEDIWAEAQSIRRGGHER